MRRFFPVVLVVVLTISIGIAFETALAKVGDGTVQIKVNRMQNRIEIKISDPTKIGNYWLFEGKGIAGAVLEQGALECPLEHQINLPLVQHNNHQHTVHYVDCQSDAAEERWNLPANPTDDWKEGDRTIPSPGDDEEEDQSSLQRIIQTQQLLALMSLIALAGLAYLIVRVRRL